MTLQNSLENSRSAPGSCLTQKKGNCYHRQSDPHPTFNDYFCFAHVTLASPSAARAWPAAEELFQLVSRMSCPHVTSALIISIFRKCNDLDTADHRPIAFGQLLHRLHASIHYMVSEECDVSGQHGVDQTSAKVHRLGLAWAVLSALHHLNVLHSSGMIS